jgi:hypothetical protein
VVINATIRKISPTRRIGSRNNMIT